MSVKGRKARLAVTAGLAAALALGGVVAPVAQAYADSGYSVTVQAPDDSAYAVDGNYKIYQLFTGTFGGADNTHLGNVVANPAYSATVLTTLNSVLVEVGEQKIDTSDMSEARIAIAITDAIRGLDRTNQQKFANKLAGALATSGATATQSASASDGTVAFNVNEAGYYLIASSSTSGATTSAILVPVNGNVAAKTKVSTPTVTKQVKVNDEGYKKNTDVGLTSATTVEKLTYKLEGTVASNIADYDAYTYVFTDTLPTGVTVTNERVDGVTGDSTKPGWGVKVTAKVGETTKDITASFSLPSGLNGNKVTWTCGNLKQALLDAGFSSENLGKAKIALTYTPDYTVTELGAALVGEGMPAVTNTAKLSYSNNPYIEGAGTVADATSAQSKVYTYKLSLSKVKKASEGEGTSPLDGAKFTLKRFNSETNAFDQIVFENKEASDGSLAFTGLDSGVEYELSETTVPAGMKSIDPIKFKIVAVQNTDGTVTKVTANKTSDPSSAATFVDTTDTDNVIDVTVTNIEGPNLPTTGQQGIVAGVAVGGIVLTVSLVAISRNRKRSE